jgi:hypothetical protein
MGSSPSSQTKEQQQATLEQTQTTMAFDKQLMDLFQKQFANQQDQLTFLKGILQPVATAAAAGKGFQPAEEAALRATAADTIAGNFANAKTALNQTLREQGDINVPSGVTVGADLALANQTAQQESAAQNQITLANAEQARQNLFNATDRLSNVANLTNPNPLAGEANSSAGTVAGLSGSQAGLQNAITSAQQGSFFNKLTGGFASALGNTLGGGNINLSGRLPGF